MKKNSKIITEIILIFSLLYIAILANYGVGYNYLIFLSYSLIGIPLSLIVKNNPKMQREYCFFIPFLFGVIIVSLFMVGMAIESYSYLSPMEKLKEISFFVLPKSFLYGAVIGLLLGVLSYLFGGITFLFYKLYKFIIKY